MVNLIKRNTRCLLVQPSFSLNSFWNYREVCRLVGAKYPAAPLGLLTVAALLPQHWELRLVDENTTVLSDAQLEWADLVLTGGMLPQQAAILQVLARAHAAGKPVVVGGPDPTSQSQLYAAAEYRIYGEGEVTIPMWLADLERSASSGEYRSAERADMSRAAVPRFDLIRFADYMHVGIQFSRGCPYNCEFCDIIELFGRVPRCKSPRQILAELECLYNLGYRGHIDFVDDNFIGNKARVIEVLEAMADWSSVHGRPFFFSTEASINLAKETRLLELMQANDFRFVFVGIESPDDAVLSQSQKLQNRNVQVAEAVRILASYGMIVNGGFILGFDNETAQTAGQMVNLIQDTGICMAMVGTLSALPNTQLSRRLEREGRLFPGGLVQKQACDVDQTTSGLNFVTARARAEILRDYAEVFRRIYSARQYYQRLQYTALNLRPGKKSKVSFDAVLKLLVGFLRLSAKAGIKPATAFYYWRALFIVLLRNPKALEAAANLAAMYTHFSKQSDYVINLLEERISELQRVGEEAYNQLMFSSSATES
ncbi:MAG: B12-binding domain-containing radical SAM protein [Anaerolineae bacterium]